MPCFERLRWSLQGVFMGLFTGAHQITFWVTKPWAWPVCMLIAQWGSALTHIDDHRLFPSTTHYLNIPAIYGKSQTRNYNWYVESSKWLLSSFVCAVFHGWLPAKIDWYNWFRSGFVELDTKWAPREAYPNSLGNASTLHIKVASSTKHSGEQNPEL